MSTENRPPTPRIDGKREDVFLARQRSQIALLRIGGEHQILLPFRPHGLLQRIRHHQKNRRGFRRAARFGDDVEQRAAHIQKIQQSGHRVRIGILETIDPRPAPFVVRKLIVKRMQHRTVHRLRSQRRAANAHMHVIGKTAAHIRREPQDFFGQLLFIRQIEKRQLAGIPPGCQLLMYIVGFFL
ncbi:MAG: hypothetical protein Q9P14_03640 [candidate division KSB1 bacterium]|nr:hypothetical protein [candidate division KSB1 bacterium]